ncbi:mucin-2-like [Anopheles aquasalis]|uniref:mucin-2-like n=1 Tax=Anopheles aquasalis TaxID=42839 RepID=UPI00215B4FFA|nr:mucin-2-like [Anopheles aquasalis]
MRHLTWKLLILVVCLTASGLARPDVSHLFKKTGGGGGDKQKRQNFIETSVAVSGNGSAATVAEIRSNDAAVVEGPAVRIMLFPLEDNQPSPFRRLEDRTGYNYDKPDAPLDVHPDSNLVSPVSTQAPEYLPPEVGDETVNVDDIQLPSKPYPSSTTTTTTPGTTRTTTTRTTTTTTPVTTTTTSTTTGAPYTTNAIASTPQEFDGEEGYGYKKPEIMLPTNINEVIGEPIDINQLATTTEPTTTTTTPRASLEYLPPKPKPDLDAPKSPSTVEPFTETTTTGQPQSSTTYFFSIETSTQYPKLPEVVPSVYPDASGSVSSVVRPQPTTEVPSTSAPEYLPPDETAGFQIIVRTGSDDVEEATSDASTTVASTTVTQFTEPSTTVAPAAPEVDSLVRETSTVQQELEQTFTTTTTTTTTTTPEEPSTTEDTSSMVSLINQLQEMLQIAAQAEGFAPEVRFNEEEETATSTSVAPSTSYTTITASSTVTTVQPTTAVTEPSSTEIPTTEPSETPSPPLESRISPDEPSGPSLIDLLSPAITTMLGSTTANDTITTYRPQVGISDAIQPTTTKAIPGPEVQESNADETEVQPRIADPNDGYNYQTPDNSFTVPTMMVAPSHTLEADGYHYKVPSVPFP